jgi:hypothetical protein
MSEGVDDKATTTSLRLVVQGFWLPVGRTNFFNFEMDRDLIADCNAYDKVADADLTGYTIPREQMGGTRISASVYRRLINVLSSGLLRSQGVNTGPNEKRYSRAYPMYNVRIDQQFSRSADPDTVALVCTRDNLDEHGWAAVRDFVDGIVLMVVSEGLYVWLVPYRAADDQSEQDERENDVRHALTNHIIDVVGGDFYNHSSGRPKTPPYVSDSSVHTLEDYRDMNLGILTYSQINVVLEGLYNAMLDPEVFFENAADSSIADSVKKSYSLGNFIELIRTNVDISPDRGSHLDMVTRDLHTLLTLRDDAHEDAVYYFELFQRLRETCLNVWVRRDILRQFTRRTSIHTLHLTENRIQSCNRALLATMIGVAHLHRSLVQVDVPITSKNHDGPITSKRYVIPEGATEGQLRGYILLLAAKFPLVESTYHFLDNTIKRLKEMIADKYELKTSEDIDRSDIWRSIAGVQSAREALLASILDSIKGLEEALKQAYMDDMLIETEKIRTEEETLTEIERIRERESGGSSGSASLTVNIISNALALATVLGTLILGINTGQIHVPTDLRTFLADLSNVPIIVLAGLGLVLAYLLFQMAFDALFIRPFVRRWLQRRAGEERNFYEMDVRLDTILRQDQAEAILAGNFSESIDIPEWSKIKGRARGRLPRVDRGGYWRWKRAPFRSSYRVSRTAADDAAHKIYVVATVIWPRGRLVKAWLARHRIRLFVVYEVLFRTPVNVDSFELRNVRVVSATRNILESGQLRQLELVIVHEFINRWIASEQARLADDDAVFSLVRADPT